MIDLNPEDITEFQSIWKQQTGEDITPETAKAYAQELLSLVDFVAGSARKEPTKNRKREPP